MTLSPVMQALVAFRAKEVGEREVEVAKLVQGSLGNPPPPIAVPAAFERWCEERNLISLPCDQNTVALYVMQNAKIGQDELCRILAAISLAHYGRYSDPVGWAANAAMTTLFGEIPAPRSWPLEEKAWFATLPYHVARVVARREKDRERTVRNAQNEAGDLRRKLKQMTEENVRQKPKQETEDVQSNEAAA